MKNNTDEINRAVIIESAAGLFQKWGYNKTTMEDIAKAAGKGKSTLYYYYNSKEEIFYTFMVQSINEVINAAKSKISKEVSAEDKLRIYVATLIEEVKEKVNLYEIVTGEMRDNPLLIDKIRRRFDAEEIDLINNIIKTGIQNKEFKKYDDIDIKTITYTFVSGIRGLLADLYIDKQYFYDADRIHMLMELFFHGIKR